MTFIIAVFWGRGGKCESFKDGVCEAKKKLSVLAELNCQILFMGQNEWKYAFDRVFAVKCN